MRIEITLDWSELKVLLALTKRLNIGASWAETLNDKHWRYATMEKRAGYAHKADLALNLYWPPIWLRHLKDSLHRGFYKALNYATPWHWYRCPFCKHRTPVLYISAYWQVSCKRCQAAVLNGEEMFRLLYIQEHRGEGTIDHAIDQVEKNKRLLKQTAEMYDGPRSSKA